MGQSSLDSPFIYSFNMKMFVVLALAAVAFAEPEADPYVVGYNGFSGFPYTAATYSSPLMRAFTPYSTFSTPLVHRVFKREAEADPAVVFSGLPVTSYSGVHPVNTVAAVNTYSAVHPVNTVAPVTSYSAVHPVNTVAAVNTYSAVSPVTTYTAAVPTSHSVTSYKNPEHYTAVKNFGIGPNYIAKNYGVQHVAKREAEADPAVVSGLPVSTYSAVHPFNTYSAVHPVNTYTSNVAVTPFGLTHSSNVGVCLNNVGQQVPC